MILAQNWAKTGKSSWHSSFNVYHRYLELFRRAIRKPTIITMNNEETIRPDTSHTEIELTLRLLCPLPSGLGPELGRELGTWKQKNESSKFCTTHDDCCTIPYTCPKQVRVRLLQIKRTLAVIYRSSGVFYLGGEKYLKYNVDFHSPLPD